MSSLSTWVQRVGRRLTFLWKKNTTEVPGVTLPAAENEMEKALEEVKKQFPKDFAGASKATVDLFYMAKDLKDGRLDPLHVNFNFHEINQRAHYYPEALGGRHVWWSKAKYNNGEIVNDHFSPNPAADNQEVAIGSEDTSGGQ
ncbi:MAG: hypothetical protein Q9164_004462 [Protoblastenia rupestris]